LKEEYKGAIVALQNLRNPIVRTKWVELTTITNEMLKGEH